MAAASTRKKATPKKETVTVRVVVSRAIYIKDADDSDSAVRILQNGEKLNITRVTKDYYADSASPIEEWESCDDSVTLTAADLKTAVEALDA
jgi:hypothetical protein